ncbi:elongation factor 4 [candidate division Kazan bacterium RIFCSPHIGHO2_01_FULL_44_14]|uniref:Elongation factor 4 n=1 Tax=candidate division Kazan bacterium RIFCSPLOWO2_01_FULL_45_19 TaxID=1798538 RepID=A0A1F4NQG4_UNCK3|nr:MAG: elongation factor 4 [candidate division Kazan bacterium RIFCSPLOWO2_01_FULL_45_19]OGB77949.1 MAG: elongation factor 4 [candidate division Kazan bacterium RIFCSPHIGHO2_01_FULL_44_14]
MTNIRNFCIIAHIDHGKSTLADRLLELTNTISSREMRAQYLDTMDLERERGITIKLQPVRMHYDYRHSGKGAEGGRDQNLIRSWAIQDDEISDGFYELNLIDTPGHVDFTYEVSRSLAAVEGALLVVDASQGIEAQTLANLHLAQEHHLTIIPVVNKIDLPAADPDRVIRELQSVIGIEPEDVILVSAKTGEGVEKILDAIVERVPAPKGNADAPLRALVFDSYFDQFRGVVAYVRIVDGEVKAGDNIVMMASRAKVEVMEVGCFAPKLTKQSILETSEIGYIATGLKDVRSVRVGDTITLVEPKLSEKLKVKSEKWEGVKALEGYKQVMPFVYAGIFTIDNADFPQLRDALDKLQLNDSSLIFEPESSPALGFGFRCGFLGLLHLDIVQERLEREFNLNLVTTTPSVSYEVTMPGGDKKIIHNPTELPPAGTYKEIAEPWIRLEVVCPAEYVGNVMQLIQGKRGVQVDVKYLDPTRSVLIYEIPLASVVTEFYDQLKSVTSGYASMAYEMLEYRVDNLVKVDILLNTKPIDTLSVIIHRSEAQRIGQKIATKLKELLPRQNFKIVIQAAIGGKVIAREELSPYRKDVTAKLYGGDVTRKNKLLDKQKKGKKRMKMVGDVEIPQSVFRSMVSN